jgi:hypothetical protein
MQELTKEVSEIVQKAKTEGFQPVLVTIAGVQYIFRPVTRKEWRELLIRRHNKALAAKEDPLKLAEIQQDEMESLVNTCLLHPKLTENCPAGVIESLSDSILVESGFQATDTEPIKL